MIYTGHDNSSCRWWPTLQPLDLRNHPPRFSEPMPFPSLFSNIATATQEGWECEKESEFRSNRRRSHWPIYSTIYKSWEISRRGSDKGNRWRGKLHREMVAKTRFRLIDSIPRHFERARVFLYVSTPSPWGKSKISRNSGDEATTYEVKVVASVIQSWRPS